MLGALQEMTGIVSIVACGPSALKCGAARAPGFVIAVNDAFLSVRHDAVLSMDGRWAMHRAPEHFSGPTSKPLFLRDKAWRHIPDHTDARYAHITRFACERVATLTLTPGQLNGENSGHCALNLAYQMNPDRIYLYGFDMKHPKHHFHRESEWRQRNEGSANSLEKFAKWRDDLEIAAAQFACRAIPVLNTNQHSASKAFPAGRPE